MDLNVDFRKFAAFSNQVEVLCRNLEFNDDVVHSSSDEILDMLLEAVNTDKDVLTADCDCMVPDEDILQKLSLAWSSESPSSPNEISPVQRTTAPVIEQRKISPIIPTSQREPKITPKPTVMEGFITAKEELVNLAIKENRPIPEIPCRQPGLSKPSTKFASPVQEEKLDAPVCVDERLKGIDPKLVERIENDIIVKASDVSWDDIKGLEFAKDTLQETIVYPLLRPDLFTGLRKPAKGLLLFGPPGTGKTLMAKCVAKNANASFFNVSSSTLTSKWIGEGEMSVRVLFLLAQIKQPSVVFIDEIDALLSKRSENEHESSRRLKTEFLVFLDGAGTGDDEQVLLIGATNRPQELDEAARRRFTKRLYIPLPDYEARKDIIIHHIKTIDHSLADTDVDALSRETEGFSGADLKTLCQEAALTPMRELLISCRMDSSKITTLKKDDIPRLTYDHFNRALNKTRPSVSNDDLKAYIEWNKKFGSGGN